VKALKEYDKYRQEQDKKYISDFDREVKRILESDKNKSKKNFKQLGKAKELKQKSTA